jgi:hypothetical protein
LTKNVKLIMNFWLVKFPWKISLWIKSSPHNSKSRNMTDIIRSWISPIQGVCEEKFQWHLKVQNTSFSTRYICP